MRLNHIDLYSPVVAETASFLINHFDLTLVEKRGKDAFYRLSDGSGLVLVVSPPIAALGGGDQVNLRAQTYHIGFLLPARTEVDEAYRRMTGSGVHVIAPEERHGAYVFYAVIPGNILVEVGHRADA
ncbi:VOC family protein [Ensifer sp. SSB1]|jgi:catechol 2,3-dioxygenase-like lactoylglutathione lyase family enzyme|uniref:VOC family protein n=1 Tax=Ensifer sp. SSB1 TaxID=2795385 RepID=UPI001A38ED09|nr:VOC family protein [Ensifer sp. SSB1]MBK5570543.1 VOC family protein [Ensifer sp. SSB1]